MAVSVRGSKFPRLNDGAGMPGFMTGRCMVPMSSGAEPMSSRAVVIFEIPP